MRFVVHHTALLRLAELGAPIPDQHEFMAPSSSRSHVLSILHEGVHRGEISANVARDRLRYVRGLRLRLLGDAVMQKVAWEVADGLGWPTTYDAEYIALTMLQADALLAMDDGLSSAAREFVLVESLDALAT